MKNLVSYGILLNEEYLENYNYDDFYKIRIKGYERHCNHLSLTRSDRCGVFTIKPNKYSWINGILITGLSEKYWKDIIYSERSYELKKLPSSKIKSIDDYDINSKDYNVFVGSEEKNISSSVPYLIKCINGARQKGSDFFKDFCRTSFVYEDGKPLRLDKKVEDNYFKVKLF